MSERNMALLSQSEIDTLIAFLSGEKDNTAMSSEVLSQDSIDKLINLIRNTGDADEGLKLVLPVSVAEGEEINSFFRTSDDTYTDGCSYALCYEKRDGEVYISGRNSVSGKLVPIRPCDVTGDGEKWGRCVLPVLLKTVAQNFRLEIGQEALNAAAADYAEVVFGDANAVLPALYLG